MYSLITIKWPEWLRLDPLPEPPRQNVIAALRAEFQGALATQKAELQAEIAIERQAHERTREELAQSRDYGRQQARTIDTLDSTVKSQQRTLENNTAQMVSLTTDLAVANERYSDLRQEYHQTQVTNTTARQKLHERVAQLETIVERLTAENAGNANRAQVAEAKSTWYAEENAILRAEVEKLGGDMQAIDTRMSERGRRAL